MRIIKYFLIIFIPALLFLGFDNKPELKTRIMNYGIYQSQINERVLEEGMVSGGLHLREEITLVKQTDRIPAEIGTRFGFKYIIEGENIPEDIKVTFVWNFPETGLKDPETNKLSIQDQVTFNVKTNKELYIDYGFDYTWECVTGNWTFQIKQGDTILAAQTFEVYKP